MITNWTKRDAGLLLLALLWLAITMGVRPLALPDEGRYVSVSWEMLASGNWLVPTLNGLPFFHKPPLFYWITAASLHIFGPHEWASRIASLIGASVGVFALYGFTLRQKGTGLARLSMLILVTQPFFFAGAQFANLDMLVAGMISAAILLAAEAEIELERNRPYRLLLAGAYVFAAFGVLAKGLIGIVLPGMVIFIWLAWNKRLSSLLKLLWLPGLILFALICAPWLVAMQGRFPDFLNYFFVYNQFQRFAEQGFNNPMPFWFYLPVILILTLPWSLGLPTAWKTLRSRTDGESGPTILSLMLIWVMVIVGFFSIPSSKLVGYVLPALPPLAYLLASGLENAWGSTSRFRVYAAVGMAICLAAIVANNIFNTKTDKSLSRTIATERKAGEPVVFFEQQYFDVPFYLHLETPARILEDWDQSRASNKDNWQKVMTDAAQFDPQKAGKLLMLPAQLPGIVCSEPVTWVIAPQSAQSSNPILNQISPVATHVATLAWRITSSEVHAIGKCPETPSDAP